jgi:hypothetical protein
MTYRAQYLYYSRMCDYSTWGYVRIKCRAIWKAWRAKLENLHYLWRPVKPFLRWVRWMQRKDEPRWRAGRWKAKT